MDLSKFYNPDNAVEIELKNPIDGKGLGIMVEIYSDDSEAAEEIERQIIMENARFAKENPDAIISLETIKEQNARRLAARVKSWNWGKVEFGDLGIPNNTDSHKLAVLRHPGFKVFIPQFRKASGSVGNFIQT